MKIKKVIISGSSGFIGYHTCLRFIKEGVKVFGIDNHDNYYDIKIKKNRLKKLIKFSNFTFYKIDINDKKLYKLFKKINPDVVIHLAAQAGVRFSFSNPQKYIDVNIKGFVNILEAMKGNKLNKLIYASSSSVYGNPKTFPSNENSKTLPENIYGLTKLFDEQLAKFYFKKFKISNIGLRFFTVYGKLGRPDMFIPKVITSMKRGKVINLYNNGNHHRDFTYVDDISSVINDIANKMIKTKKNIFEIYNLCYGKTIKISQIIKEVSKHLDIKPKIKNYKFQLGDMFKTHGSNLKISKKYKFKNLIDISRGLRETIDDN